MNWISLFFLALVPVFATSGAPRNATLVGMAIAIILAASFGVPL
ncbi:hypothetical protein [Herbaspirillum chlorophenolicum]|nr:hypothetical protein [Herbaspirillum chlorophenolicum]